MKRFIDVHTGEVVAGQGEVVLKSDAHNSCLVFAAYDAHKKIGALAHAMLASTFSTKKLDSVILPDPEKAIDEMITDMTLLGAKKEDIVVRLVTGENVPHEQGDLLYRQNLRSAMDLLKQKHLKVKRNTAADVGSSHVSLDVESGKVSYA
ncbi:MAG: hypothetical protein WC676_08605 [Candidatus Omnitrophota bacterium]